VDQVILIVHVVVSVCIVGLILLQKSSADGGAAFGGGSQQSLLGTAGSAPLLTKVTVGLVALFFLTSLSLAYINRHASSSDEVIIPAAETVEFVEEPEQDVPTVTVNPVDDDIPAASTDVPATTATESNPE
jgi:preprotein translocase subunit SecG